MTSEPELGLLRGYTKNDYLRDAPIVSELNRAAWAELINSESAAVSCLVRPELRLPERPMQEQLNRGKVLQRKSYHCAISIPGVPPPFGYSRRLGRFERLDSAGKSLMQNELTGVSFTRLHAVRTGATHEQCGENEALNSLSSHSHRGRRTPALSRAGRHAPAPVVRSATRPAAAAAC